MRVLLIEDDTVLGDAVRDQIAADGHSVDWATRLDAARDYLDVASYDLILLDLMLPDGRGQPFLRALRGRGDVTPLGSAPRPERGLGHGASALIWALLAGRPLLLALRCSERHGTGPHVRRRLHRALQSRARRFCCRGLRRCRDRRRPSAGTHRFPARRRSATARAFGRRVDVARPRRAVSAALRGVAA